MALEYLQTTNFTINNQTANYIIQESDAIPVIKLVQMNVVTPNTITVPDSSTVAFPVGTKIYVTQIGAKTTVVAGVGVTITSQSNSLDLIRYEIYELVQTSVDNWILQGLNSLANPTNNNFMMFAQTQWSRTLGAPVTLNNGQTANGFTFFVNANKVANGTTSYDEYTTSYGIQITLTGTSGTANINVNGVNYLATFTTNLFTTASNWVTANQATLNALGIQVFALGSGADGRIRFGYTSSALLDAITITNVTTNLSGTIANPFTGTVTSVQDHLVIPYTTEPYNGLRLFHNFRVNFGIVTGTVQTYALSLRRYADDSVIGSEIPVFRNADVSGQQFNFISYTAGANDPFVTGGFYFALRNDSGVSADIENNVGILISTMYQKPINF